MTIRNRSKTISEMNPSHVETTEETTGIVLKSAVIPALRAKMNGAKMIENGMRGGELRRAMISRPSAQAGGKGRRIKRKEVTIGGRMNDHVANSMTDLQKILIALESVMIDHEIENLIVLASVTIVHVIEILIVHVIANLIDLVTSTARVVIVTLTGEIREVVGVEIRMVDHEIDLLSVIHTTDRLVSRLTDLVNAIRSIVLHVSSLIDRDVTTEVVTTEVVGVQMTERRTERSLRTTGAAKNPKKLVH